MHIVTRRPPLLCTSCFWACLAAKQKYLPCPLSPCMCRLFGTAATKTQLFGDTLFAKSLGITRCLHTRATIGMRERYDGDDDDDGDGDSDDDTTRQTRQARRQRRTRRAQHTVPHDHDRYYCGDHLPPRPGVGGKPPRAPYLPLPGGGTPGPSVCLPPAGLPDRRLLAPAPYSRVPPQYRRKADHDMLDDDYDINGRRR
jgi:hypothetical protein